MNIIFKKDTWQEIYHSLRNNKLRTFLTMIGVGWGMFLFVSLLGAAKGMENGFDKLFSGFATNSIFMWAQNTSIPYNGFPKGRQMNLRLPDIEMLEKRIPQIMKIINCFCIGTQMLSIQISSGYALRRSRLDQF